ncbi:MAG: peptidase [Planctomycetota bacterium]|nr:MAG: peptidase [Planctomycetota bacterium]
MNASFAVSLLLATSLFTSPGWAAPSEGDAPAMSAAALRAHVDFLASDALQGRRAGSVGEYQAAKYLVGKFRAAGLQPVSESQGWLQDIGVRGHKVGGLRAALHSEAGELELVYGQDLRAIQMAPVSGRFDIVVATSADDLPTPSSERVLLLAGADPGASWRLATELPQGGEGWAALLLAYGDEPGEAAPLPDFVGSEAGASARFWLRGGALEAVRSKRATSLELNVMLDAGRAASNVLAVLPAAESTDEWVVVSAHYDHIGTRPFDATQPDADLVFNGANDNAAGVAVMLEWARVLGAAEERPRRNLLFAALTAEEMGLVGSRYLAANCPVPLEKIVAVLNLEMLGEPDPVLEDGAEMFLTGGELSSLRAMLAEVVPVVDDPRPRLNLFRRSDNYPFAERGVIAHTLSSGGANENYHKVGDEADTLDYEHMERCALSGLKGLQLLLTSDTTPTWIEDDDESASDSESR